MLEGKWDYSRIVVIRFDNRADFDAWYYSDDYLGIIKHRLDGADCDTLLINGI